MIGQKYLQKSLCFIILAFFISGCATVRQAPPENLMERAQVYGMQDIRAFSGSPNEPFKNDLAKLAEQNKEPHPVYPLLSISGGGANGAYGAGLLCGWSQAGTRPEFKIVTGISTGAIIAPFAFLGHSYDNQLKEFYTTYSTKDLLQMYIPWFRSSLGSMHPLERHINQYFNKQLLKDVATEYYKGRRLYVGTTDLDAQRLVIWDMGKIASIGDDNALKLFRKVILASASIPIISNPVYFDVEIDNHNYQEMHVDGGVTKQVFFLYDVLHGFTATLKSKGIDPSKNKYIIYVIRNGYINPTYRQVPNKLSSIAGSTMEAITNNQSIGDLYQLYALSKDKCADFNLAYIPSTHVSKAKELFDPDEMRNLFDLGFKEASQGYPWKKTPPGLEE